MILITIRCIPFVKSTFNKANPASTTDHEWNMFFAEVMFPESFSYVKLLSGTTVFGIQFAILLYKSENGCKV
jgi:hypothetical protein